eukprot:TRINITY_DN302_c1_g3_i1.p1 TRINITY_DN302_c1_g3~~TRINITY_DN302_c1_g3_i1.p1  ORF type:complete len:329 (+),score=42.37 TRINITY_DN302_c1_g3_i1:158-1144(+)
MRPERRGDTGRARRGRAHGQEEQVRGCKLWVAVRDLAEASQAPQRGSWQARVTSRGGQDEPGVMRHLQRVRPKKRAKCVDCEPSNNPFKRRKVGSATKSIAEILHALKLQKIPAPKDGNCMFHALSATLEKVKVQIDHEQIREEVVAHLKQHGHRYADFCDENWEEYLTRLRKPGEWGDHLCLAAAAEALGLTILVVVGGNSPVLQIGGYTHGRNRFVALTFHDSHYEGVMGEEDMLFRLYDEARTVALQRAGRQPADAPDKDIGDDMMDRVLPRDGAASMSGETVCPIPGGHLPVLPCEQHMPIKSSMCGLNIWTATSPTTPSSPTP